MEDDESVCSENDDNLEVEDDDSNNEEVDSEEIPPRTTSALSSQESLQESETIITPWMEQRLTIPKLHRPLKRKIEENINQEETEQPTVPQQIGKRTVCSICPSKKRWMTTTYCSRCRHSFCKEHRAMLCINCQ